MLPELVPSGCMPMSCSQGARNLKIRSAQVTCQKRFECKKKKELTFYNISRHVVKSNCGSSFQEAGLFCTYSILFLLKQSCDNNIMDCIQMILYRGAVLLGTSFISKLVRG